MTYRIASVVLMASAIMAFVPGQSLACPICFNADPDSQIAQGINWAIFTLLGVTGGVLTGFIGFILHLVKRSRQALGQEFDPRGHRPEGDL